MRSEAVNTRGHWTLELYVIWIPDRSKTPWMLGGVKSLNITTYLDPIMHDETDNQKKRKEKEEEEEEEEDVIVEEEISPTRSRSAGIVWKYCRWMDINARQAL